MKKVFIIVLMASFVIWILPLGFFIKPSQEKALCDGQRAMCMCHFTAAKSSDKAMEAGLNLKAASASNANLSGSAGNEFLSGKPTIRLGVHGVLFFETPLLDYTNPLLAIPDGVPKF